jgi:DNA-binding IclR family transcriptional regulator
MGQREVLQILKNSKRWMTLSEISKEGNLNRSSVAHSLRKLIKWNEIEFKGTGYMFSPKFYRLKNSKSKPL